MRLMAAEAITVGLLSGLLLAAEADARPRLQGCFQDPESRLPERPLEAVVDAALGRVVVNRSERVRIERLSGGSRLRFTLLNSTRRRQSIRIGILHLPQGDYDLYTANPGGTQRKSGLNSWHLAGGWRFALPAPQTGSALGAEVQALTERIGRARLLLANRAEPELMRTVAALEAAALRTRQELETTRRLHVAIVPAGTQSAVLPPSGPWLSEKEMKRRRGDLDRLQREVVAAADGSGDAPLANRIRQWFRARTK